MYVLLISGDYWAIWEGGWLDKEGEPFPEHPVSEPGRP